MKHLDLFSGIGGFALAADRVWPDIEHTFCEIDPFCREVLKKHWPESKIYNDIKTLTNTRSQEPRGLPNVKGQAVPETRESSVFILTGGFPCQPFSQAGQRKGTADDRYLWPEMLRVIREFHPEWVIAENVGGLVTWNDGLVLKQVCTDLETSGYEVQPLIIPAVAVNAPHRRDRIWFIAHAISSEYRGGRGQKDKEKGISGISGETRHIRRISGTDKIHDVTDPSDTRLQGSEETRDIKSGEKTTKQRSGEQNNWNESWLEVATRLCRVDDGLPKRLDRNPRLKALGNAIVPQVAEEIFRALKSPNET